MKIASAAGEFEFHIDDLRIAGSDVVLTGKMGVWEAETLMDRDDMLALLRLTACSPSFWIHALKLLPYALLGGRRRSGSDG